MNCPNNNEVIMRRHNIVRDLLVSFLERNGHVVKREFTLPCGLRPDVIVRTPEGRVFALDITIAFELTAESLDLAFKEKIRKYTPYLGQVRTAVTTGTLGLTQPSCVLAYGIVFGARGSTHRQTITILERHLRVPRHLIERMLAEVVRHSIDLYVHSPLAPRDPSFL